MTGKYRWAIALATGLSLCALSATAETLPDSAAKRTLVELPVGMQQHFLANMRDHLAAIAQIQAALAEGRFGEAGRIAGERLGIAAPTSTACRPGMEHMDQMAELMPADMRGAGRRMHDAADQFAADMKSTGDYRSAIASLSKITQACVMCHAAYRVH